MLKLAAIYQLSPEPKLEIGLGALEKAIARCRQLERTIVKVVDLQLTYLGEERSEIETFVLKGGAEGQSKRDVFRNLRAKNDVEQLSILRGLLREETLFRFSRKTKGRPAEDYVHRKHVEEYLKVHPGSTVIGADQPF